MMPSKAGIDYKFLACAAKAVFCLVIVPLALVMAPAVVLAADTRARRNNVAGDNSKLGLLAAEVERGNVHTGSYVVVAAVSVQLTACYDENALGLLIGNLVLAVVGTLCIWVQSLRKLAADCQSLQNHCQPCALP